MDGERLWKTHLEFPPKLPPYQLKVVLDQRLSVTPLHEILNGTPTRIFAHDFEVLWMISFKHKLLSDLDFKWIAKRDCKRTNNLDRTGLVGVVPEFLGWVGWMVFYSANWAEFLILLAVRDWSRIDSLQYLTKVFTPLAPLVLYSLYLWNHEG